MKPLPLTMWLTAIMVVSTAMTAPGGAVDKAGAALVAGVITAVIVGGALYLIDRVRKKK